MKNVLALSLVLHGEEYINKFFGFSFKTILKNIYNLNRKFNIKFIISTEDRSIERIRNNILSEVNADIEFLLIKNKENKYFSTTQEQLYHLEISQNQKIEYLFFLYADIIFSQYSFKNSIKYLTQNRNIKVISTFALLLNERNTHFKKFFDYLLKKKKDHLKLLTNNENIIDKFHQSFQKNALNFNKSFFYLIVNKNLYIKTFHYHPIVVTPNKIIKVNKVNKKIYTLDNQFMDKFFLFNEIYIEQDLSKISLFSFDTKSRYDKKKHLQINLSNKSFKEIDNILLSISAYEKSALENKLFINNTLTYNNNNIASSKIFFDEREYIKINNQSKYKKNYYRDQTFVKLFYLLKDSKNQNKLNYIYVVLYFFVFLFLGFISLNKTSLKIYLYTRDILNPFFGRRKIVISKKNFSVIYSLLYVRLIISTFKKIFKIA
jgi:hypothetical protein